MQKTKSGFTIVELLIVVVFIAILASITLIAYANIRLRARDNIRANDIASIQRALESYRAVNGVYPTANGAGTNVPPDFNSPFNNTYSYSNATDDSWLRSLRNSGLVGDLPKDPINDGSHFYIYMAYGRSGTGACSGPFYVLMTQGWEGGSDSMPNNSRSLSCSNGVTFAGWSVSNDRAVFSNITTP